MAARAYVLLRASPLTDMERFRAMVPVARARPRTQVTLRVLIALANPDRPAEESP